MQLRSTQQIPVNRLQAWNFFSQPANLIKISPPGFMLKLLTDTSKFELKKGDAVDFKLQIIPLINIRWTARFIEVQKPEFFIDTQKGILFSYWKHEHRFEENSSGTLLIDILNFNMRIPLLNPVAAFFLRRMFRYRKQKLEEIFSKP